MRPADQPTDEEQRAEINRRFNKRLRSRYSLDTELYYARIAAGAAIGVYQFQEGEQAELAEYQKFVEGLRTQARAEKAAIGLY